MGYLTKELEIRGNKGKTRIRCLFDTGAGYSFIKKEIAEKLGEITNLPELLEFKLADGKTRLTVTEVVNLWIEINGCRISDEVLISDDLSEDMIIGAATMQKWRIKLDMENEEVIIDPKVTELKLVRINF